MQVIVETKDGEVGQVCADTPANRAKLARDYDMRWPSDDSDFIGDDTIASTGTGRLRIGYVAVAVNVFDVVQT